VHACRSRQRAKAKPAPRVLISPAATRSLAAIALAAVFAAGARAADAPQLRTDVEPALAQQLYAESLARQACKTQICDVARKREAKGEDIACQVLKTWPAVDLRDKILKGKLEWPWGNAQCETHLALRRSMIIAAMSEPKYEAGIGKHSVTCRLAAADGKDAQAIAFTIDPTVSFENGKAVKAALHWGEVSGSAAAKGALWSATAIDNAFNVLQGVVLEQINEFFTSKCDAAVSKP
jgi:hypothetical protein